MPKTKKVTNKECSCKDVAKCLAKMAGLVFGGLLALGLLIGLEYGFYSWGHNEGTLEALNQLQPCTFDQPHKFVQIGSTHWVCTENDDTFKMQWQTGY